MLRLSSLPVSSLVARRIQLRWLTADPNSRAKIHALMSVKSAAEVIKILERVRSPLSQFDVVIALHRFGKLGSPVECTNFLRTSLFSDLQQGLLLMKNLDERDLANVVWAFAQFAKKTATEPAIVTERLRVVYPVLQKRALEIAPTFTPLGLTNVIWSLAKTQTQPIDELIPALLETAEAQIKSFTPQLIANLMWALATLKIVPPEEFVRLIIVQAKAVEKNFDSQNIANLMWAFVTLQITPDDALVSGLLTIATQRSKEFSPQEFAMLMWSLATLGIIPPKPLLDALSSTAITRASEFDPQSISNFIWTFAVFGVIPSHSLLEAVTSAVQEQVKRFTPRYAANLLWSFAKLKVKPPDALIATLSAVLIRKPEAFNPQIISNTVWAFATLDITPSTDLLDVIWATAMTNCKDFEHQTTSTFLWSFALLKIPLPPALINALSERTMTKILEYSMQSLVNTLWAFALLQITPSDNLLQAITRHALRLVPEFNHQHVPTLAWSYAALGINPPIELAVELYRTARVIEGQLNAQSVANLLWAFSMWDPKPGYAVIEALSMAALKHAPDFTFHALVKVAASAKDLGIVNFQLFASLNKAAMNKSATTTLAEISAYLRRASALAALDPPVAQFFAAQVVARRKELQPEDIPGFMSVLGTRGDLELVQALTSEAQLLAESFTAYDICLLFDSFAKANYQPDQKLVNTFTEALFTKHLDDLKLSHYALILKSMSIVGANPGRTFVKNMASWVVERSDKFTASSLDAYIRALVLLKLFVPSDLRSLTPTAIKLRKFLKPSQVITLAGALTLGIKEPDQHLVVALCRQTIRKAGSFTPCQIAVMFRHLARLDALSPRVVQELLVEVQRRKNLMTALDVKQLMVSFAKIRYIPNEGVINVLTDVAVKNAEDFTDDQCFDVINSFAKLGLTPHTALLAALSRGLNTRRAAQNQS